MGQIFTERITAKKSMENSLSGHSRHPLDHTLAHVCCLVKFKRTRLQRFDLGCEFILDHQDSTVISCDQISKFMSLKFQIDMPEFM